MLPTLKKPGFKVFAVSSASLTLLTGYNFPAAHYLSDGQQDLFYLGRSFFTVPWVEAPASTTARDGLGPLFNANSCISCHPDSKGGKLLNQSGRSDKSLILRLESDQNYGKQINTDGVFGVNPEARINIRFAIKQIHYPDGDTVTLRKPVIKLEKLNYGRLQSRFSARIAPHLFGLGAVERIPLKLILKMEDVADKDKNGISGKANRVANGMIGRFNHKASAPTIKHQTAAALSQDMGLTTSRIKAENCAPNQHACRKLSAGDIEVSDTRLESIAFFVANLAAPKRVSHPGKQVFFEAGCDKCHIPEYELSDGKISPYSDFLLHDMGDELADEVTEFDAEGNEWRTALLWGNKYKQAYLHDGRAQSPEEAILWHGGEARAARDMFWRFDRPKREQLLDFLEKL